MWLVKVAGFQTRKAKVVELGTFWAVLERSKSRLLGSPMPVLVLLPLYSHDCHEMFDIFDGDPRGESPHGVLEIGIEEVLALAVNNRSTCSMQYL